MIMQEGMDSTLKELSDLRIVRSLPTTLTFRHKGTQAQRSTLRLTLSSSTTAKSSMPSSVG
jgi:hypothetical protein